MARIKGLTDEILDLSIKDLIALGKNIEEETGISFIPTIDLRILPSPKKQCNKEAEKGVNVILLKIGDMKEAVARILERMLRLSKKEMDTIFANGYGQIASNISKVRANALRATLEAVGSEVELK